jgi:hypothetical protein
MSVFSFYLKAKTLTTIANVKLFCIACVVLFSVSVFVLTGCMVLYFILFVGVSSSRFRLLISVMEEFSQST